jgi:hypothetical protein
MPKIHVPSIVPNPQLFKYFHRIHSYFSKIHFNIILLHIRFEVFTAATMKNGVFRDVTPCDSCKNQRFGGTLRLLHQGDKNR